MRQNTTTFQQAQGRFFIPENYRDHPVFFLTAGKSIRFFYPRDGSSNLREFIFFVSNFSDILILSHRYLIEQFFKEMPFDTIKFLDFADLIPDLLPAGEMPGCFPARDHEILWRVFR
jgi:hypothetical protein